MNWETCLLNSSEYSEWTRLSRLHHILTLALVQGYPYLYDAQVKSFNKCKIFFFEIEKMLPPTYMSRQRFESLRAKGHKQKELESNCGKMHRA